MKKLSLLLALLCLALLISACNATPASSPNPADSPAPLAPLPPPEPDGGPFGVDLNINMDTIDDWLERPDVAYRDMRLLFDPADFESIGGISPLTQTLPGYRITPLPHIANLTGMMPPIDGVYDGERLFEIEWSEEGKVLTCKSNFKESELILSELFPKDRAIFLMCGGAGYSMLTRALLTYMGWDENLIYSTGGNWYYEGDKSIELIIAPENADDDSIYALWRANYAIIDFDRLTPSP